jgi:uncharacterized protein YjaZ
MKKNLKSKLFTIVILISIGNVIGQHQHNKIIFLNDYYSTYTKAVKKDIANRDHLYKEKVQTAILNSYFLKSEYAYIVNDFLSAPIQNTTELKQAIKRIKANRKKIEKRITSALKRSYTYLKNEGLTIYVLPANPDNKAVIKSMSGIMGLTAGSKQVLLTIEPEVAGWEEMLEYAVAHEYNHMYWTKLNFGKSTKWTLLDYLVFEGKGDSFAHLLYPKVKAPWTNALNKKEQNDLWNSIQPKLQSEDVPFQMEVMFGSRNYPYSGGYTIGYNIVQKALKSTKLTPEDWINLNSEKLLEMSRFR